MSTSISGLIEYTEVPLGNDTHDFVVCFCAFPDLGNSSILARLLRERCSPLPEQLSYDAITELTVSVVEDSPDIYWSLPATTQDQAERWVAEGASVWVSVDGQSIRQSDTQTSTISSPHRYRSAGSFRLDELEKIQHEYQRESCEGEDVVAIAPGEPLPERVVGFAGTDSKGRTELYVASDTGPAHTGLAHVIACMKTASELVETEPRFISILD
jgi:hypothetical protein